MALYHIWLIDAAGRTIAKQSKRRRYDAAVREALRVLNAAAEAAGVVESRQHHVAANAIRMWLGSGEVITLIDDRHEIHLFRG